MHFFLLVFVFISRSRKLIYSVNIKILVCQIIGPGTCSYARGLVVSFLNSTTRTRPDQTRPDQTHGLLVPPASPRTLSGRRLVRSVSTYTDFVRESGLVSSGRRQNPWVRAVDFNSYVTSFSYRRRTRRVVVLLKMSFRPHSHLCYNFVEKIKAHLYLQSYLDVISYPSICHFAVVKLGSWFTAATMNAL